MTKKTLAFVVYPGISLLELVGNRTVLGIILAQEGSPLKAQVGYELVVVGERIEEIPTDTPLSFSLRRPSRTLRNQMRWL